MNLSASAVVHPHERKCDFFYDGVQMLSASVLYPEVALDGNAAAQDGVNLRIRAQVGQFERYLSEDLYRRAVQEYRDSKQNDFPFRMFGAALEYQVTYNRNCHFSVYSDRYEYTGGAHGLTTRASNTWSLETGHTVSLGSFFLPGTDYRRTVLDEIFHQADRNMQQTPGIYFDDYRSLIRQYFDPRRYYLTPDGAAVYFQQYEIAPYSSGIIVFTVPYGLPPACRLRA